MWKKQLNPVIYKQKIEETSVDEEGENFMNLQLYLEELIPKKTNADPLVELLYGKFNEKHYAVIPQNLGRITRVDSHEKEYNFITNHKPPTMSPPKRTFFPDLHQRFPIKTHRPATQSSQPYPNLTKNIKNASKHRNPLQTTRLVAKKPSNIKPMGRYASMGVIESIKGPEKTGPRQGVSTFKYSNGDYYEGEWQDDTKNGAGSYFYSKIGALYKGQWHLDNKQGLGKIFFKNGDKVKGIWEYNKIMETRMTLKYKKGYVYEGEHQDCMRSGLGRMTFDNSHYFGEFLKDNREGKGYIESSEFFFEGTFKADSSNGPGVLVYNEVIEDRRLQRLDDTYILNHSVEESFKHFQNFPEFNKRKLNHTDIVYMTLTKTEFELKVQNPNILLKEGSFEAGKLTGLGMAKYGAYGMYIGNFVEGKRSGWGVMVYNDPEYICLWTKETEGQYIGYWKNDQRHGFGTMVWNNKMKYEGYFNHDRRDQVTGSMIFPNEVTYTGSWVDNCPHGMGQLKHPSEAVFKGQFIRGKAACYGILEFSDGNKYEGEIENLEANGAGKMLFENGNVYEGIFKRGVMTSNGKMEYWNGDSYEGEWDHGFRSGEGVFKSLKEKTLYKGEWKEDKREGFGVLVNEEMEVIYEGEWSDDKRHVMH